jgi:hypothetical protein
MLKENKEDFKLSYKEKKVCNNRMRAKGIMDEIYGTPRRVLI